MSSYMSTKQVIKEHEIVLNFKRTNENLIYLMAQAGLYPDLLPKVRELIKICPPIELDDFLNNLLDAGEIRRYEFAKSLVAILL